MIRDWGSVKLRCAFGFGTAAAAASATRCAVVSSSSTPRGGLVPGRLLGALSSFVLQGLLRFPDLGQPRLAAPQLLRQLVPTRVLAEPRILLLFDRLGLHQQLRHLVGQIFSFWLIRA